MSDQQEARPVTAAEQAKVIRTVAAEALSAVAATLWVGVGIIAMLMLVVWIRSASSGESDFPGRYLFALLPLAGAAVMLGMSGKAIGPHP